MKTQEKIFLIAGEQSGDLLGGQLMEELKKLLPSLRFYGVGGPSMQSMNMTVVNDWRHLHVMGFTDVIRSLPRLYKEFQKIKKSILQLNPLAVIFIDYPDFNMKMAKALRKSGFKGNLVQYVSPSVWAWRKNRIYPLSKTLDLLLTILPFEKEYYKKTPLNVVYVGNPLVSVIDKHVYDLNWKTKLGLDEKKPLIAIFPGSRVQEIEKNLRLQYAACESFKNDYQIALSVANPVTEEKIHEILGEKVILVPHRFRYELMKEAEGAIATSGTVILELGLHGVPTLSTYRLNSLNYFLGRYLFKIRLPFYTLVNIICKRSVFPEFIHKNLSANEISHSFKELLANSFLCKQQCQKLKDLLENKDAGFQAAAAIKELCTLRPG